MAAAAANLRGRPLARVGQLFFCNLRLAARPPVSLLARPFAASGSSASATNLDQDAPVVELAACLPALFCLSLCSHLGPGEESWRRTNFPSREAARRASHLEESARNSAKSE